MNFIKSYGISLLFFLLFGMPFAYLGISLYMLSAIGYGIPNWMLFRFGRIGLFLNNDLPLQMIAVTGVYFFIGCLIGKIFLSCLCRHEFIDPRSPKPEADAGEKTICEENGKNITWN